jgi:hypothetical protein
VEWDFRRPPVVVVFVSSLAYTPQVLSFCPHRRVLLALFANNFAFLVVLVGIVRCSEGFML